MGIDIAGRVIIHYSFDVFDIQTAGYEDKLAYQAQSKHHASMSLPATSVATRMGNSPTLKDCIIDVLSPCSLSPWIQPTNVQLQLFMKVNISFTFKVGLE